MHNFLYINRNLAVIFYSVIKKLHYTNYNYFRNLSKFRLLMGRLRNFFLAKIDLKICYYYQTLISTMISNTPIFSRENLHKAI